MGFSWMQGEGWGPKQQGNSIQQRLCQLLLRHGPAPSPRGISGGAALSAAGAWGGQARTSCACPPSLTSSKGHKGPFQPSCGCS